MSYMAWLWSLVLAVVERVVVVEVVPVVGLDPVAALLALAWVVVPDEGVSAVPDVADEADSAKSFCSTINASTPLAAKVAM